MNKHKHINRKIIGVPYGKDKTRGNMEAMGRWVQAVIDQTEDLPKIEGACFLKITFFLPPDKYPTNFPYGPNIDNLLKRFFDALNKTIFSEIPSGDSCIISLSVKKKHVDSKEKAGAYIEVLPVSAT